MEVLLIENNDLNQSESLLSALEKHGCRVAVVHTPETAAEKTETLWPSLIVFNPVNSHLELASFQMAIGKSNLNIPYVIVSDQNHLSVQDNGETVLVAPGKTRQLTQGITKVTSKQKNRFIRLPNLIIDREQRQILRNKKRYALTPKELKLLLLLIENQGQVLSRKIIMKKVWETDYMGDTRTLDVHIRWLREKIEENPSQPQCIITIRGVGYRFVAESI